MAGRGHPPRRPGDGSPGGGDDEYRSIVFDESFVEAARLQEYSARERLEDEEHAAVRRRPRPAPASGGASRQAVILVLLIAVAFGTAIYLGIRTPYQAPPSPPAEAMRVTMLPLAPRDTVPGGTPGDLFASSPAADLRVGAEGVNLPPPRRTDHFSENQTLAALTAAKEYVVASSVDPEVLMGGTVRSVRLLLDPAQHAQFDRSVERPRPDGRHAATGWMVRFDPAEVALADPDVRVQGTLAVRETGADTLEVTADHVFTYALHSAEEDARARGASLFTVRREVHFRFERADLRDQQLRVETVSVRAGPLSCSAPSAGAFQPLLAGERARGDAPAGTDPYEESRSRAALCGVLADTAQPAP
ncbi:hypothetical protein [Streptomyces sp. JJ36]|uniref:SCO2583 family membrane protein n=1 Tax=Streptomyces sp. JJ36 TaxID=2736645 RepID=UPI001F319C8C|nr:hypothetical protein [Streptomyces sp. JJ36]MCF6521673.1 hypothetical protein [Streptomyces sp. JJ36]